jgi:hypothetical protein
MGATETLDVEQLGAGSGTEGVEAFPEAALELIGSHGWEVAYPRRGRRNHHP